jgi:UDPglucose 6-dehydrogenase
LDAVMDVNRRRAALVGRRLEQLYESLRGLTVGMLGLTYKAGTSTLRRAISLEIIRDLAGRGVRVKAFDPLANLDEVADLPPVQICRDPYDTAQESDALILVTEWTGCAELDWSRVCKAMRRPVFIDTRNLLDPSAMRRLGFVYTGIGRAAAQGDGRG